MTRPIVHIGYHKTATSWFQKNYYPRISNRRYIPRNEVRDAVVRPNALRFDPETARRSLAMTSDVIMCEEALCGHYETGGLNGSLSKDMAQRVAALAPDAEIVIFIRRQPDFIVASYLQYLRRGGTFGAKRFVFPHRWERLVRHKPFKKPLFNLDHYDYRHLVRLYQGLFGQARVHVFPFEAFLEDQVGFLERYGQRFGFDISTDALTWERENVSYRSMTARLARYVNRLGRSDVAHRGCALALLPKRARIQALEYWNRSFLAGGKVTAATLFDAPTRAYLNDYFADANTELAQELDLDLARYGYPMKGD